MREPPEGKPVERRKQEENNVYKVCAQNLRLINRREASDLFASLSCSLREEIAI